MLGGVGGGACCDRLQGGTGQEAESRLWYPLGPVNSSAAVFQPQGLLVGGQGDLVGRLGSSQWHSPTVVRPQDGESEGGGKK